MSGIIEEVTIGDARLILGDCREVLPGLGRFDLLLTDPPYGIGVCNRSDGGVGSVSSGSKVYGRQEWDQDVPPAWLFDLMREKTERQIIWGGNYYDLPPSPCWLVWDKGQRDFTFADGELAWTSLKKAVRFLTIHRGELVAESKRHPTQKPLRLMEWCLQQAGNPKSVLDPFAGSFSTGVACVNLGISFTGIEREPRYFEAGVKRIEAAHRQPRLFQEPPAPPEQVDVFGGAGWEDRAVG